MNYKKTAEINSAVRCCFYNNKGPFDGASSDEIIVGFSDNIKNKRAQSVSAANSDNFSDIPVYLPKRLIKRDTLRTEKAGAISGDIQTIF